MRSKTDTGRQGEFLAAYILETHGVEVHHVDREGADLWCKIGDTIKTIQVKSASQPTKSNSHTSVGYYNYLTRKLNADYFAFVALDRQLILVKPTKTITTKSTRFAPSEFNEVNQRKTIEAMMAAG